MLINFDFSQVEVFILAQLSGDQVLINLLNQKVDIYKYFASIMYDKKEEEITPEERKSLKAPILGISYGRGANALANETGKSKEWCQSFIDRFYDEFPRVKVLHDSWIKEVNSTGYLKMQTGIRFKFYKYIWNNQTKKKERSEAWNAKYWEPEIKNYPIQHTAFLILSLFLATFWREKAIHNREKYLLINTVHDSVMLDSKPEYVEDAKNDLNEILAKLPELCYNKYGIKLVVDLRAEIETGDSWYEV